MTNDSSQHDEKLGSLYALGAYTLWGFFPAYWKWLGQFSSFEVLAHRIIWAMAFYWAVLIWLRGTPFSWLKLIRQPKYRFTIFLASALITFNWLVYIWAVNHGRVIETSLGYFISPLLHVLMGWLILKEKLTPLRWVSVSLAALGVLVLALQSEAFPYVAIALAVSFASYGLIRKKITADVFETSTAETAYMALPAILVISLFRSDVMGPAPVISALDALLLFGSGLVTGLPLVWFAQAARRLPLSKLGFYQYISPSLQFSLGAFVYHEPLTPVKLYAFIFIWLALGVFSWESIRKRPA